jgi:hypothetical protein
MTRFAWSVDVDEGVAHVPVGGTRRHAGAGVSHTTVACAAGAAVVTLPPDFPRLPVGGRSTGVALAHGDDAAATARPGRLLTELAAALALHGFVVVRPGAAAGEHRRAAVLEAALDAAASSPFARGVRQWVRRRAPRRPSRVSWAAAVCGALIRR